MKFAIVEFPGSNCDHDAYHAAKHVLGQQAEFVWHKDADLRGADAVVLPGGFSYGDYLRNRRDRAVLAGDGGGSASSPAPAGRSSASATGSRCCSRPACSRAPCCGTAG